jgi:hypothetical protein
MSKRATRHFLHHRETSMCRIDVRVLQFRHALAVNFRWPRRYVHVGNGQLMSVSTVRAQKATTPSPFPNRDLRTFRYCCSLSYVAIAKRRSFKICSNRTGAKCLKQPCTNAKTRDADRHYQKVMSDMTRNVLDRFITSRL